MRIELELVFKHFTRCVEKVNLVNYLTKPPLPMYEYYYEKGYLYSEYQTGGF